MHGLGWFGPMSAPLRQGSEVASGSPEIAKKSTVLTVLSAIIDQGVALSWFGVQLDGDISLNWCLCRRMILKIEVKDYSPEFTM